MRCIVDSDRVPGGVEWKISTMLIVQVSLGLDSKYD